MEDNDFDGVDLLLSMLDDEDTSTIRERGKDDMSRDTPSTSQEFEKEKKTETNEQEMVDMKAKMIAMEEELATLKQQLTSTTSEHKDKRQTSSGARGEVPTAFKKGKRVAHQQGAEFTRPPLSKTDDSHHHRLKQTSLIMEEKDCITDKYSGLRIRNPLISKELMNERMANRQFIKIPRIVGVVKDGDIEGDWVTMGVIVSKSLTKETCKGKKFSVWRISDLTSQSANISLFLFDRVYHAHWKTPLGHVIALLNCSILTNKETNSSTGVACYNNKYSLSLDNPAKLMDMGVSADFTICKATTKSGKPCQNYASKQFSGFCDYHAQNEYSKMRSKRMNFQGGYGPNTQSLQKKLLGQSDVMYQGQLFTGGGGGASSRGTKRGRDKEMDTSQQRLFAPGAKRELREVEQLLGVMEPISSGCGLSDNNRKAGEEVYKQLIKGQTPGALCIQKHFQKNPANKSEIARKDKSALDLLKEHSNKEEGEIMDSKPSSSSTCQSTPNEQSSAKPRCKKKPALSTFEEFDLFKPDNMVTVKQEKKATPISKSSTKTSVTPAPSIKSPISSSTISLKATGISRVPSHDKAKEKAMAMIKDKGPLKKIDPNRIHSNKILDTDQQDKIKQKLMKNEENNEEKGGKEKRVPLIEGEEFDKILNAKSTHNWAIEEDNRERQEVYFNNLEKKEQLQEKLSQLMELDVRVVQCTECNYIAESVGSRCQSANHHVTRLRACKRCFQCSGCGHRTYTYNQRYPNISCQCGENKFKKCSLYKTKAGPKLPTEELLLRGHEQKFLNSLN